MTRHTPAPADLADLPALPSPQLTADYLGLSLRTVYRYIDDGRPTAIRLGPRLLRITRESIAELVGA